MVCIRERKDEKSEAECSKSSRRAQEEACSWWKAQEKAKSVNDYGIESYSWSPH